MYLQNIRQKLIDTYSRGGLEIPSSYFSVLPRFTYFIFFLIILEFFNRIFPSLTMYLVENFTWGLILLIVTVFVAYVLRPIISLYSSYHEITYDNLVSVQGFTSFFRKDYRCSYELISGVEVRQNILGRLTDMGDILVGTSMRHRPEIIIKGIQRPQHYAHKIHEAIDSRLDFLKS